jgi:hypothetical protein
MTLLQTDVQALVNVISLEAREVDLTLGRLLEMLRTTAGGTRYDSRTLRSSDRSHRWSRGDEVQRLAAAERGVRQAIRY